MIMPINLQQDLNEGFSLEMNCMLVQDDLLLMVVGMKMNLKRLDRGMMLR
jgi:hypothetical protein